MPKLSALVHVEEGSHGAEETLRSICVADDVLVILDPRENDKEMRKAIRHCHGRVKRTVPGVSSGAYAMDAFHNWVLILRPGETLTESAEQQIGEWKKKQKKDETSGYRVRIRRDGREEEHFRLVNRLLINWTGELPPEQQEAEELQIAA